MAGGLAGLFWSLVWCYAGQSFIVLSLAEMASMAPVRDLRRLMDATH
jgi:choline transport protein